MDFAPRKTSAKQRLLAKNAGTAASAAADFEPETDYGTKALGNMPLHYSPGATTTCAAGPNRHRPALSCLPTRSQLDREVTSDGKQNQTSRFTFSRIKDRLMHLYVRAHLRDVRDSVAPHDGTIGFKFAQTKGAFLRQIMKHSKTSGGVCESLSAHWIARHGQGQSLFDRLYTNGQKGQFQIDELYSIKQLHIEGMADSVDQDQITESWLAKHDIRPRWPKTRVRGETGAEGAQRLLDAMLDTADQQDGYKKVGLEGAFASHTMAVYVHNDEGIVFFDPNFGEFRFPDKGSFRRWFAGAFWQRSGYHRQIMGLGEKFEVFNYEPKSISRE